MKRLKYTTQEQTRRILRFVYDLIGCHKKALSWMKKPRDEWRGYNAIEMIEAKKLHLVMKYIEKTLF